MSATRRLAVGALLVIAVACSDGADPVATTTPPPAPTGEVTTTMAAQAAATTTVTGPIPVPPTTAATPTTGPAGGTPTSTTTTALVTTTTAVTGTTLDPIAAGLAVREAPLTVVTADGTEVVFSEWFFATFNREARVQVVAGGTVLAEGVVTDPAVMEDRGVDGFVLFGPDGSVVATVTQEELLDAANQALIAAGLDPSG